MSLSAEIEITAKCKLLYTLYSFLQSMERSFEDLLHGLSDDDDLDLDDLVGDNTGYSTNLEVCMSLHCWFVGVGCLIYVLILLAMILSH